MLLLSWLLTLIRTEPLIALRLILSCIWRRSTLLLLLGWLLRGLRLGLLLGRRLLLLRERREDRDCERCVHPETSGTVRPIAW